MVTRLNKFLAQRGIASRRNADELIRQGRVEVNGLVVEDLGVKVDELRDQVSVDGKKVRAERRFIYYLLNKPSGYLVTLRDPLRRPTVRTLMPKLEKGVFPVGRLDQDSEGLLLLTNDGELAFRLTHPRYEIKKTYLVRVAGQVLAPEISMLQKGVYLDGRRTARASVTLVGGNPEVSSFRIDIHEGRKREIRRMFETIGHRVVSLKRTAFAGLNLHGLPLGKWRPLAPAEIRHLKRAVGLDSG